MNARRLLLKRLPALVGGIFFLVLVAGIVLMIRHFLDKSDQPRRRVQQIAVIRPADTTPPPPPPLVAPEEKPSASKQDMVLDEPTPQQREPGENLGLDTEGNGAGDVFGLVGIKGGRELVLGGKAGDGSGYVGYLNGLKKNIQDELARDEALRTDEYRVDVAIWIARDGKIYRYELLGTTGLPGVDAAMKKAMGGIRQLNEPPGDMPQPVKLRITSH
ncbi:MAG TPA: TonB C-terminal domain-containing protein [Gallionella sp.]|nr:TonB C-terminal domain-containing protein [Gallionella sp.]